MTILRATCDVCNEIIKGQIYEDYDYVTRCHKCHIKSELYYEERKYKDKLVWLKKTHIKELKKMRKRIVSLRKE